MAKLHFTASINGVTFPAVTRRAAIMLKAPTNQDVAVKAIYIGLRGQVNTDLHSLVEIAVASSDGTMTALTPQHKDRRLTACTIQTACYHTATTPPADNPTVTAVLRHLEVHPQGNYGEQATWEGEDIIARGGRWLILVTAPVEVSGTLWVHAEE